ncbi:MAG: polyamine aminopropyltransferase [Vampirovibrionia bacterium]
MNDNKVLTPDIKRPYIILLVVCIVAVCGIIYELLISTAASYLLGDSVTQFSIIIGIYMSSMGIGAYLSKFIHKQLFKRFLQIEILLSIVGGASILLIFLFYSLGGIFFLFILYGLTVIIGILVGLEIPLVIRIMEDTLKLKENVANVLAYDYIGGLIGSISFPLLLLPTLGIMKTAILIGIFNLLSAIWLLIKVKEFQLRKKYLTISLCLLIILITGMYFAKPINNYLEQNLYKDKIIISEQTPYQKLVVTKYNNDIRLFIDGNLQFSSIDEYRYHEGLIHIPASIIPHLENVLILGGGDGLAVKELLKYKSIKKINLVDLDAKMIELFKTNKLLTKLNKNSLNNEKVTTISEDGLNFIKNDNDFYDLIIIDLPDPRTTQLSNLYNKQFYELIDKRLSKTGVMVTQATSPFFANKAFWCVAKTVESAFPYSSQYHINVMSFGDWGFVIGSNIPINVDNISIKVKTRFLTDETARNSFIFEKDIIEPKNISINTLFDPVIVQYYKESWGNW